MIRWLLAAFIRLFGSVLGLRPPRPRAYYPPPGPAHPLHANSVQHGDQHGARRPAQPPGPPGPARSQP